MSKPAKAERKERRKPALKQVVDVPAARSPRNIIAYQIYDGEAAPIRPARGTRKWMDDADEKFPYRCLPLVMANQYGWQILSTHHVRASWDGTSNREGLRIEDLYGDGNLHCQSDFGEGVLTFQIPFLFKTPEGWNLMVRGPTNSPKDGIIALDGIIETDWAHSTFTMNWRFTRACTVEFTLGEPICQFFPVARGALETFRGEIEMLKSEPELDAKFRRWSDSRQQFLSALRRRDPDALARRWQKEYFQTAKDKRPLARPFVARERLFDGNSEASPT